MPAPGASKGLDELDIIIGAHRVGPVLGDGIATLRAVHACRGEGLETKVLSVTEENRGHGFLCDGGLFRGSFIAGKHSRIPAFWTAIRPPGKEDEARFTMGTEFHRDLLRVMVDLLL